MTSEFASREIVEIHGEKWQSNIPFHDESIAVPCPVTDGQFYRVVLEADDLNRLYICFGRNFVNYTTDNSFKLEDVIDAAGELPSAKYAIDNKLDLTESFENAPIFISSNLESGVLVAIDGNHRLIAHFLTQRSAFGIHAYVFEHTNARACNWFHPSQRV